APLHLGPHLFVHRLERHVADALAVRHRGLLPAVAGCPYTECGHRREPLANVARVPVTARGYRREALAAISARAASRTSRASAAGSAVRSCPPSTTGRPATVSSSSRAGGPHTSAHTGSAMGEWPRSSRRHSATSACLPTSSEPISSCRPRHRAP